MTGPQLIEKIEKLMGRYGQGLEFFAHGPGGPMESGFGPAMNWAVARIEFQENAEATEIMGCFIYGLPLHIGGGPLQYPVKSPEVPFYPEKQAPL